MAPLARSLHARARTASYHRLGKDTAISAAQRAAISPDIEQGRADATATVDHLKGAGKDMEDAQLNAIETQLGAAVKKEMRQPQTEDEADEVMNQGAARASATVQAGLAQQREATAGGLAAAAKPNAADAHADLQPAPVKVDLQVETPGPQLAAVDARPAVPPPLPAEKLDYSSAHGPTDQLMADSQVTTQQLQEGNDPAFGPALNARADAEKKEEAAEPGYRKEEEKIRTVAEGRANVVVHGGLATMHGIRTSKLGGVGKQQQGVQEKDAAKRKKITDDITRIKDKTKADVELILTVMDMQANMAFDAGLKRASDAYEAAFKEEKGGLGTWLTTWGSSWRKLIARALAKAQKAYTDEVSSAIHAVATIINDHLNLAKQRVVRGRLEVDDVVKHLEGDMYNFGEQAKAAVQDDFGAMETHIDEHRDALVNKLSERLKADYQRMNERAEELRKENQSLWDRVYDATVGAIKKIIEFKNLLFSVLAKAAEVVLDIIAHPIRFLGNLVSAVGQGLRNFKKNIGTHLQKGLMDWLFGALAGAGLKLPEKFDLEGIVSIVLQILGLTYENFRARAVNLLGEQIVASLEKSADVFMVFMREGAAGIWRFIKEKVDDLKSLVLDAIWSFIKEEVIMAGIEWIIGLLNPVSAFFKACKAIYEIVVFVVNRASQLVAFVSVVVDSLAAIVAGNLGAATAAVEDALARAIPLAIGLLASLLGLGDPSKTVKATIDKARSPINKAIDWVITQAARFVKAGGKVVKRLMGKKQEGKEAKEGQKPSRASVYDSISATLGERLSQDHTLDAARGIVTAVAHEFKPMGVSQILVAPPDEQGNSPIIVEMSPGHEVGHLASKRPTERHSVSLNVELTLAPDPALVPGTKPAVVGVGIVPKAVKPAHDKREYEYLGAVLSKEGTTRRAVLESQEGIVKRYDTVTVGGMIFPESKGRIRLRTWNTDSQSLARFGNQTHAEMQFVHWLRQMQAEPAGRAVLDRVIEVKARLVSLSPCSICGELFPEMTRLLPSATLRQISWNTLYSGPSGPTSVQTVREIAGAHWTIVAPQDAMPQGTPIEHYVNRPRK